MVQKYRRVGRLIMICIRGMEPGAVEVRESIKEFHIYAVYLSADVTDKDE